ncbi:TPA: PrgI family protein [Candidatus Nomurabacteria bacterium]|nr:MAG: hypothetical protein O210_OD1C00001G0564 [Parcubacteria bacterium RAAC4_OD1_1]HCY26213.1 PrgI family protein [Candidatus Nomurabacteria bacterium]
MQFRVPQFIDIEDKLFGPFTFRQFVYLTGGAGGVFVLYKILPFWLAIIFIIPVISLTLLLTFYKINEKPFIYYLEAGLGYFISNKLYLWKQRKVKKNTEEINTSVNITSVIPMSTGSNRLGDLSFKLDTEGENTNISAYKQMKKDNAQKIDLNITEEDIVKDISNYDTINK